MPFPYYASNLTIVSADNHFLLSWSKPVGQVANYTINAYPFEASAETTSIESATFENVTSVTSESSFNFTISPTAETSFENAPPLEDATNTQGLLVSIWGLWKPRAQTNKHQKHREVEGSSEQVTAGHRR